MTGIDRIPLLNGLLFKLCISSDSYHHSTGCYVINRKVMFTLHVHLSSNTNSKFIQSLRYIESVQP